jgi:hypothetical protein
LGRVTNGRVTEKRSRRRTDHYYRYVVVVIHDVDKIDVIGSE